MAARVRSLAGAALALALGLFPFPAAPAEGEKEGWKKLFDGKTLDGWKQTDFFGSGKVSIKDGALLLEKGKQMTGVTLDRKDFPHVDYEVTFEARKVEGSDFFCTTTFPVQGDYCSLVVGGWGGTVV